ncbi:MAG TPA: nucleotide exchange factor GrpE [Firmicutes bacterium]|jgi:molecular chaperone GrpE|nr:nucleotide exchange factor GrpE [Bacillota bacterium]
MKLKGMDERGSADARLDLQEGETADKSQNSGKTEYVEKRIRGAAGEERGQAAVGEMRGENQEEEQEGRDEVREDPTVYLEELKREKEELSQRLLRLRADFENYRRRSREELQRARGQALEEFILKILPVVDNLERAVATSANGSGDKANLHTGVEMVFRQFMEVLEREGVTPIAAVGEMFDPGRHEAFCREESEEPENTILEEMQRGYLFGEKTIRPSLVKVAVAKEKTAAGESKEEGTRECGEEVGG